MVMLAMAFFNFSAPITFGDSRLHKSQCSMEFEIMMAKSKYKRKERVKCNPDSGFNEPGMPTPSSQNVVFGFLHQNVSYEIIYVIICNNKINCNKSFSFGSSSPHSSLDLSQDYILCSAQQNFAQSKVVSDLSVLS